MRHMVKLTVDSIVEPINKSNIDKILELTKTQGGTTTQVIARVLKISSQIASNLLGKLYKHGQVNRYPWIHNSYRYEFMSDTPIYIPERQGFKKGVKLPVDTQSRTVSVYSLIEKWSKQSWEPKIFDSARNLPLGIARLYELAVDIAYGAAVDKAEIDDVRANINEFYQDLERTISVVKSILDNGDLWTKDFAVYLIQDKNPEILQELIRQVKEFN